jgi:thioredoxin 1
MSFPEFFAFIILLGEPKKYKGVFMSDFLAINEENFEEKIIKANKPMLLEFGASWCKPCKSLEPLLLQLAEIWEGKVCLAKLDVDENPNLVMQYQVMSVPTTILFVDGEARQILRGLKPRDKVQEAFSPYL